MPALGSFRGCDTCRKWKKKCDRRKPKCSLCTIKNLPCVGADLQRFKFKDLSSVFTADECRTRVSKSPSNGSTQLAASLLWFFQNPDQGQNSCWMIPEVWMSIIGTSPAVDKSLSALFSVVWSRQSSLCQTNMLALKKYTCALAAVRDNINDPATRYQKETLVAVYLLTICDPWMTDQTSRALVHSNQLPGHFNALEHIATVLMQEKKKDEVLLQALSKAALQLLIESPFNSERILPSWMWELWNLSPLTLATSPAERPPREAHPTALGSVPNIHNFSMEESIIIRDLMRNPRQHLHVIKYLYCNLVNTYPLCVEYCEQNPVIIRKDHIRFDIRQQTIRGESQCDLIYCGIVMNAFLRTVNPEDDILAKDRVFFCSEAVRHGEELKCELPISALDVPPELIAAWCVAEDAGTKAKLRQLMEDYRYSWSMCHILRCIPNWKEAPKKLSREIPWIPPYKYGKEEWIDDFDTEMWKYCSVM